MRVWSIRKRKVQVILLFIFVILIPLSHYVFPQLANKVITMCAALVSREGSSLINLPMKSNKMFFREKVNYFSSLSNASIINQNAKIIILWTPFFGNSDYIESLENYKCQIRSCIFTSNRSQLELSDAIILHLRDVNIKDLPKFRNPHQRWILLHHESPPHTPSSLKDLNNLINWTATYREGSDVFLSPKLKRKPETTEILEEKKNYAQNKTRMVAWLVSNCNTPR